MSEQHSCKCSATVKPMSEWVYFGEKNSTLLGPMYSMLSHNYT